MAVTLTNDNELLYASFPIEKTEVTADGDLVVYGKASDGGVDSDNQIVDPQWMGKAVQEWLSSGANLRVQHNAQRDPAGVGLEASTDNMGATWVKGLVVEPIAQKLVSKGALRAYSVGIARPTIVRDAMAPGGRITGGELVEVSLVDRPANKRCGIQLVKSADDGTAQWVGEMFGDEAEIQKALSGDVTKASSADMTFEMPADMSITFTPNDLAKILKNKIVEQHYGELAMKAIGDGEAEILGKDHREFSADERRHNASAGNALPDGSYPIPDKDALRRAAILARSKHGNWQAASRLIARRARELGVPNPMDDNDSSSKGEGVTDAPAEEVTKNDTAPEVTAEVKEAEPVLTKEPADADDAPKPKKGKKGKKLPAFLQQAKAATPADDDADDDDSGDGDETDDTCKLQHTHTEKCMPSGTPQSASGAKDAPAMAEMPDPNAYQHSPMPAGRATPEHKAETAAMLRFKTIGIDTDLGRLHDLTCPAYHPEDVAKYHPFSSLENVIDTGVWQRKAVDAACGPIEHAMTMTQVWQAAETLKGADLADLNDYRLEMHKAFRDANPGPVTYPSPGSVSPSKFNRPCITDGQAARSPGYGAPNSSPAVAGGPVTSAHGFTRPPLGAGHQSPSPSFMKADFEYPSETGVPVRLNYAQLDKERARSALSYMHDHLAHAFPMSCPMLDQDATRMDNSTAPPPTAGVSKSEDTEKAITPAAVFKAPVEDEFASDEIYKAFKKMRKKLGKRVLSGKMTVDEARSKLGRNFTQKDEAPETVKAAPQAQGVSETPEAAASQPPGMDPEVIKSAVTDAVKPFLDQLTKAEQKIQDQQAVLDKIANMPDPSTAAFTGLAVNPVRKSARPAGVPSQAEVAERTQQMIIRQLERTWRTSENPAEREAARGALDRYQGVI